MRLSRRQALILGCIGAPATGIAALALRHGTEPGIAISDAERRALRVLTPREYATLRVVFDRLARDRSGQLPPAHRVDAALFADGYLREMPDRDRTDLKRLLGVIEHVLPVRHGSTRAFTQADGATQDAVLQGMEHHPLALLRMAFGALKQLASLSYFRDARTWPAIGYEGPRVPPAGSTAERPMRSAPVRLATGVHFDVDAVIVGAGAGGSMAAREIARRGARVLLLEEGPDHPVESFTQREDEMLPALFQDRGGRATSDRAILVMQGRGLGGSTIHNQNLCKRAPEAVLAHWARNGCDGWDPASLSPLFAEVERDLHVTPIDALDVNPNNDVLRRGASVLGWRAGGLSHNRDGCTRSGFCEVGCAYDGKNNARKVLIPEAVAAGAIVRANTKVVRVRIEQGRAVGLVARDTHTGAEVNVRARAVVLAASAVGSAAVALASDVPDPHERIGVGLHLHPGGVVAAMFDREIAGWRGIPQSWECTEWLDFAPGSQRRVWIVPAFAHPVGTASMLPGVGPAWTDGMRRYRNLAVLTSMLHDESEGRVRVRDGRPVIEYALGPSDREQMARGLKACAEILLAAGAPTVVVPFAPPLRIRSRRDLATLTASRIVPHGVPLTAVHPMSTMRAGGDPRTSVCDPRGRVHTVRGLYVADGGLFPTSIGGPPQISIYMAGMKVGRHVADDLAHG